MVTVQTIVDQFIQTKIAAGLLPETISQYRDGLRRWLNWRQQRKLSPYVSDMRVKEIRDYMRHESNRPNVNTGRPLSAHTIYGYYRTLRGLWKWAEIQFDDNDKPLLTPIQTRMIAIARPELRRLPRRNPGGLPKATLELLISAARDTERLEGGLRDEAILLMLYESGMRIHELCQLTDECTDLKDRSALIIGKGRKALGLQERVFWGPRTAKALDVYLLHRRGGAGGPLFRGTTWKNDGGPVTTNSVRCTVKRLAKRAGVHLPVGACVHSFRSGAAQELRRRGAALEEVRDVLRHNNIVQTKWYIGEDDEARRRIHRKYYPDES